MKIVKAGSLVFSDNLVYISGWTVSSREMPNGQLPKMATKDVLRAALLHIAQRAGIELSEPEESCLVPLDVEREAADIIAMARWEEQQ